MLSLIITWAEWAGKVIFPQRFFSAFFIMPEMTAKELGNCAVTKKVLVSIKMKPYLN